MFNQKGNTAFPRCFFQSGEEDSGTENNSTFNCTQQQRISDRHRRCGELNRCSPSLTEDVNLPPEFELRDSHSRPGHLGVFSLVDIPEGTVFPETASPGAGDRRHLYRGRLSEHYKVSTEMMNLDSFLPSQMMEKIGLIHLVSFGSQISLRDEGTFVLV